MQETYTSLIGLWLMLTTLPCRLIATGAHRRQSKMVPGIVDPALSHDSLYSVQIGRFASHWKILLRFSA